MNIDKIARTHIFLRVASFCIFAYTWSGDALRDCRWIKNSTPNSLSVSLAFSLLCFFSAHTPDPTCLLFYTQQQTQGRAGVALRHWHTLPSAAEFSLHCLRDCVRALLSCYHFAGSVDDIQLGESLCKTFFSESKKKVGLNHIYQVLELLLIICKERTGYNYKCCISLHVTRHPLYSCRVTD